MIYSDVVPWGKRRKILNCMFLKSTIGFIVLFQHIRLFALMNIR